jgi:hypothetical protein
MSIALISHEHSTAAPVKGNVTGVYRIPVRRNSRVETRQILQEIDAEIARLTQVRHLLAGSKGGTSFGYGAKRRSASVDPRKRRVLSAKARKAISDAQKKRWAKQKAAAKKAA